MAGQTPHGARPNREATRAVGSRRSTRERTARPKPPGRPLEPASNAGPRGMVIVSLTRCRKTTRKREQDSAYGTLRRDTCKLVDDRSRMEWVTWRRTQ